LSGRKIVVPDHSMARLKQTIDQITTDKASCASDEGGMIIG
jgi:hypothetical protein